MDVRVPLNSHFLEMEEHSFYICMLKLVVTKGQGGKVPKEQLEEAIALLKQLAPQLLPTANLVLNKLDIAPEHQIYSQTTDEYCVEVSRLSTPVNLWQLPSPPGSCGGFDAFNAKAIKQ